ncbi:MAG: hypothetical protein KGP14_04580 [Betaproteobacteria bacterium]|nr:hypothetical protein [Betaproteobacteria bacterium]
MFFAEESGKDQAEAEVQPLTSVSISLAAVERISEIAQELATLSAQMRKSIQAGNLAKREPVDLRELARAVQLSRAARTTFIDQELIGEPAWDILLALATDESSKMSVKAASSLSGAPPTTALRWLALLEQRGLISIDQDANDGRRKLVGLTDDGRRAISGALQQFSINLQARDVGMVSP